MPHYYSYSRKTGGVGEKKRQKCKKMQKIFVPDTTQIKCLSILFLYRFCKISLRFLKKIVNIFADPISQIHSFLIYKIGMAKYERNVNSLEKKYRQTVA